MYQHFPTLLRSRFITMCTMHTVPNCLLRLALPIIGVGGPAATLITLGVTAASVVDTGTNGIVITGTSAAVLLRAHVIQPKMGDIDDVAEIELAEGISIHLHVIYNHFVGCSRSGKYGCGSEG